MKKCYLALVMGLFLLSAVVPSWGADVTQEIYFSTKTTLTANKTYTFRFSLLDAETGGVEVWSEEKEVKLSGQKINT